jgi:hypothetical protein
MARINWRHVACSLGLSATSQQYFSLRTNQPPVTSQQYFSQNKSAPAISHPPNEQAGGSTPTGNSTSAERHGLSKEVPISLIKWRCVQTG